MSNLWGYILNATIYGSITGIAILIIINLFRNKINKKYAYLLWMILIIKLIIPFGPESKISLFNKIPIIINKNITTNEITTIETTNDEEKTYKDNTSAKEDVSTENYNENNLSHTNKTEKSILINTIPIVWLSGAIIGLITHITIYLFFINKLRKDKKVKYTNIERILDNCKDKLNIKRKIHISIDETINSPSLIGIFKPRIILPLNLVNLSEEELKHIFLHELCHYKNKDSLIDNILALLQCLHWFNPLIWYLFKQVRNDMEMACDERVLDYLNEKEHNKYGLTMLTVLEKINVNKSFTLGLKMADDKKTVKERVNLIKNSKHFSKKKKIFTITGLLCLIIAGGVLLTNGITKDKNESTLNYNLEISDKLDNAIREVIIEKYVHNIGGEYPVLSYDMLGKKENANYVEVYLMATYGVYEFSNNVFSFTTGVSNIPLMMKFSKNEDGEKLKYNTKYYYLDSKTASDGDLFEESLYEIFQRKEAKKALKNIMDDNYPKTLLEECNNQAKKYVKSLVREAEVTTEYAEKEWLSDILVHAISNKGEELDKYPQYIGTREELEKGKRYIYETKYDERIGILSFYKYEDEKEISLIQYKVNGEDIEKIDPKNFETYFEPSRPGFIDNEDFKISVNSLAIINNNAQYYVSIENKTNETIDVKLDKINKYETPKKGNFQVTLKAKESKYANLIIEDISQISDLHDKIHGSFISNGNEYDFIFK